MIGVATQEQGEQEQCKHGRVVADCAGERVFASIAGAARALGFGASTLHNYLTGKREQPYGLAVRWATDDEYANMTYSALPGDAALLEHARTAVDVYGARRVVCVSSGAVFETVGEASLGTGCGESSIRRSIASGQPTSDGLLFRWATVADVDGVAIGADETVSSDCKRRRGRPVVDCKSGVLYCAATYAAAVLGLETRSVLGCCRGYIEATGGYCFRWATTREIADWKEHGAPFVFACLT